MKIGIYSPYLSILGGGERYLLNIAEVLSQHHEVYLLSQQSIKEKSKAIFDISLSRVQFLPETFLKKTALEKYILLRKFDVFFYMTDGSLFLPSLKRNFLIIQSPIHIPKMTYLNRLKLINWKILCYSQFMQKIIEDTLNKKADILSPCINLQKFKNDFSQKQNIILTVGRFFPYPHNKKQDLLVEVFKRNYQKYFKGWKFIIAGGLTEVGGKEVLDSLEKKAQGLPIEIITNPSFNQLVDFYKNAKLYWHAAGFAEDIDKHPERVEHFGITTLEAMAASAVPLVFAAGGQKDIIDDGDSGYLWKSEKELVHKTYQLITSDKLLNELSKHALVRATEFTCRKFYEKVESIITG